ncbi:PilN domain-containing protein [Lutibacter sp. B2]|nr:PilN domain-containing protein [Lutibacter sp. B2]
MRDFNFFSPYVDEKKTVKKKNMYVVIIIMFIVISVGGVTTTNILIEKQLQKELLSMQKLLTDKEIKDKLNDIDEKKRKIEVLTKYHEIAGKINQQINNIDVINSTLLENISSSLPQKIFIQGMAINHKVLSIQGVSSNRVAIAEFEYNLKQINIFYDVHVNMINNESMDNTNKQFSIECTFFKDVKNHETD